MTQPVLAKRSFTIAILAAAQAELAALSFDEAGLFALGGQLAQDCGIHGGDRVAESGLTFDRLIDRSRLVPLRGSGWQPE